MRKTIAITCIIFVSQLVGCAISDVLFSAFEHNYTGGGITRAEKKDHYNQQVEASQNYNNLE